MLNNPTIRTESAGTRKTIFVDKTNSTSFSCIVGSTGIVAGADGKKIMKAGTPIYGDLTDRDTAFVKATTTTGGEGASDTSNAVGICQHDVDVTSGSANGSVTVFGFIDVSKLEADVQALITPDVKTALNMIKFVK